MLKTYFPEVQMSKKPEEKPRIEWIELQRINIRQRRKNMIFWTRKVRTLRETASVKTVIEEIKIYKIKIRAIEEMRWTESCGH